MALVVGGDGGGGGGVSVCMCDLADSIVGGLALPACLCPICMQCLQRPKKGMGSSGTGVKVGCELPCGCWGLNLGLLEGQLCL